MERRVLFQAAVLLPCLKVGLRIAGYERCRALLERLAGTIARGRSVESLRALGPALVSTRTRTRSVPGCVAHSSISGGPVTIPSPTHGTQSAAEAQAICLAVGIAAAQLPFRLTCLHRSLAAWWLLARRGIASDLRIGVRKDGDQLQAHAWVECEGVPTGDRTDGGRAFLPFEPAVAGMGGRGSP